MNLIDWNVRRSRWGIVCVGLLMVCDSVAWAQRGGRGGGGGGTGERIEPKDLSFEMGVARIPDRAMFERLSYQGPDVMRDSYLADLEFVKFIIEKLGEEGEQIYFMNTENYRAHPPYMGMVGIDRRGSGVVRGAITYHPRLATPSGGSGLYVFDFQPNDAYAFEEIRAIRDALVTFMPPLQGKVAFHPLSGNLSRYEDEKTKYENSDVAVHLDGDLYRNISFLPLNQAESFGLLRVMDNEARSSPRDIVICRTLPNQMPRVAGVISEVRQTPLSHVNLRAVQDKVPNAYIKNALADEKIASLVGRLVAFTVTSRGYTLREASKEEVEAHFQDLRPEDLPELVRDLSQHEILPLRDIRFENAAAFGVKTANLAVLRQSDLPAEIVPDGFGIPFYFYDQFMSHNRFYQVVDELLADEEFRSDRDRQRKQLKKLRKKITSGTFPTALMAALDKMHESFSEGGSIRCRSSTNNEDLPGFSGAGLYDSYTHRVAEGHVSKTIKQVFASLWNFRAFEERDFFRIDHRQAAMGVLVHRNFEDEKANGVAVTDDVLYESFGNYYLNSQIGEDLVTNPDAESSPEEVLLGWWEQDGYQVVRRSTAIGENELLLEEKYLVELREHLAIIHRTFRELYGRSDEDAFAMEIEYKITADDRLMIKQARPWVF